jgi:hypothetical protein
MSSPEADKPAGKAPASGRAGSASAGGAAGAAAAAKSKVPDFGLADQWEVIKLLGTGEPKARRTNSSMGPHAQDISNTWVNPEPAAEKGTAAGRAGGASGHGGRQLCTAPRAPAPEPLSAAGARRARERKSAHGAGRARGECARLSRGA